MYLNGHCMREQVCLHNIHSCLKVPLKICENREGKIHLLCGKALLVILCSQGQLNYL